MKQIYLAIRSLRKEIEQLPPELVGAARDLQQFESLNRGHSNELDDLAMAAQDRRIEISQTTRLTTFRDSIYPLCQAAERLMERKTSLSLGFLDLLSIKDESGFLQTWFVRNLRGIAGYREDCPKGYSYRSALSFDKGTLQMTLWFEHTHLGLKAERTFGISCGELHTLESGIKAARALRALLTAQFHSLESLDEFAPKRKQAAMQAHIRERLAKLCEGFNAEEKEWLVNNWSQAKPHHLPRSTLA